MYYGRSTDTTTIPALSTLRSTQSKAITQTIKHAKHLLDYLHTHLDTKIHYYPSNMILDTHSEASYLSKTDSCSHVAQHYFLGWLPTSNEPIRLNGAILNLCEIIKLVATSTAEAELGALFLNVKE
jgi:hypothetical protein